MRPIADLAAHRTRSRGTSPAFSGPLFGRDADLERVADLASRERLVTVLGPPGVGKTRLAALVASKEATRGAVVWCALADVASLDDLVAVVHEALGVEPPSSGGGSALGPLSIPSRTLVVLDNLEHLVEDARGAISAWLDGAPELRLLVTSRRLLGLPPREIVHELGPLSLTDADGNERKSPALELFLHRARRIRAQAVATESELLDCIELVRELEGFPLAIELAASHTSILSPRDLARGGARWGGDSPLDRAIERSWSLLSDREREVLAQCTVFRGGFTVRSAESVLAPLGSALALALKALREASLLRVEQEDHPLRLGIHAAVRSFAEQRLARDARAEVQARHAHFFSSASSDDLASEIDNALAALSHLRSVSDEKRLVALLAALAPVLTQRGPLSPYLAVLDDVVGSDERAAREELLPVYMARAAALRTVGRTSDALAEYARASRVAKNTGNVTVLAEALVCEGGIRLGRNEERRGALALEEALRLLAGRREPALETTARAYLAYAAVHRGDAEEARRGLELSSTLARACGNAAAIEATSVAYLGLVEQEGGMVDDALAHYARALALLGDRHRRSKGYFVGYVATAHHECGRLDLARAGYLEAQAILAEVGDRRAIAWLLALRGAVDAACGDLEDARARLSEAEAIALATEDLNVRWLTRYLGLELLAAVAKRGDTGALGRAMTLRTEATAGDDAPATRSWDVRFALRLFARSLVAMSPIGTARVAVSRDGRWFEVRSERVSLVKFQSLCLLLAKLAAARERAPGSSTSVPDLVLAGWPGQRVKPEAGANRVHVALAKLRRLGLREVLRRTEDGYLLDEAAVVEATKSNGD